MRITLVALVVLAVLAPASARAALPESDADGIAILGSLTTAPGDYWWDHTDITVSVSIPGHADPAYEEEIRAAIDRWNSVLAQELGGVVKFIDVSGAVPGGGRPDIQVRYVESQGGVVFCCRALCQAGKCSNVSVSSLGPPGWFSAADQYTPEFVGDLMMHELGHALGLGHAEPLLETTDLMGYGWLASPGVPSLEPVVSACDVRALRLVWAWALEGTTPRPPDTNFLDCG